MRYNERQSSSLFSLKIHVMNNKLGFAKKTEAVERTYMAFSFSITYMFAWFLHGLDVVETYDTSLVKDLNTTKYYLCHIIRCITYLPSLKIFIYLFKWLFGNDSKCVCLFLSTSNWLLSCLSFTVASGTQENYFDFSHVTLLFRCVTLYMANVINFLSLQLPPSRHIMVCTQRNYWYE